MWAGAVPTVIRGISILSDILVLIITWMESAHTWRTSLQIEAQSRPTLLTLFLRNGMFIFLLSERKLTYLRYPVFYVSMLSQVYLSHRINKYLKRSVYVEHRVPGVGCDHS